MVRGLSEDQPAEQIGDIELRVEVRLDVQEFVQPVVIRRGHLQVPRHLDRLEPDDVGQNIPEPERELRPPADRGKQARPLPAPPRRSPARRVPRSRRQEKPMETRSAKAAAHPHTPLDASFIPAESSPCPGYDCLPCPNLVRKSIFGIHSADTIQRAPRGARSYPRKHQGAPKRPLVPSYSGDDSVPIGLCPVCRPDEHPLFVDRPTIRNVALVLIIPLAPALKRSSSDNAGARGAPV